MALSAPRSGATHLATKVELTISCNNLMDMDVFSKSDPLCALYINTSGSHWHEVCTRQLEYELVTEYWCLLKYIVDHLYIISVRPDGDDPQLPESKVFQEICY